MTRPTSTGRPIVALDVDGVLNVRGVGWPAHTVAVVEADLPDHPFRRQHPGGTLELTVHLNPAHGRWIRRLQAAGAEVVWATTWEATANLLAPHLGIGPLPIGVETASFPPGLTETPTSWKGGALSERCAGQPLCWIDDFNGHTFHQPWQRWVGGIVDPSPTLAIRVDRSRGLTSAQMGHVTRWVRQQLATVKA